MGHRTDGLARIVNGPLRGHNDGKPPDKRALRAWWVTPTFPRTLQGVRAEGVKLSGLASVNRMLGVDGKAARLLGQSNERINGPVVPAVENRYRCFGRLAFIRNVRAIAFGRNHFQRL